MDVKKVANTEDAKAAVEWICKKLRQTEGFETECVEIQQTFEEVLESQKHPLNVCGLWELEELVEPQSLARLMKGETVQKEPWSAYFDKTSSSIRMRRDVPEITLSIQVESDQEIATSLNFYRAISRPEFAGCVLELEELGIFRPGSAYMLGFFPSELSTGRQIVEKTKNFERVNKDDINSLKTCSEYTGGKTEVVLQNDALIMEPGKGVDGLYTFGANPCAILIAVSKEQTGIVKRAGMAHIDAMINAEQIAQFLNEVKQEREDLEVHIIGGCKEIALCIFESCEGAGAQIKFCSANLKESRVDAAIVDIQGTVYYGNREDLNVLATLEADNEKIKEIVRQARLGAVELSIRTIRTNVSNDQVNRSMPEKP